MIRKALSMFAAAVCAAALPAAESALSETRVTVEKLVQTRQLIARLKADWQADQETLEQTIKLFERESQSLKEQLARTDTSSQQVQKEHAELLKEKEILTAASDQARALATALESDLKTLVKSLPPPVVEKIEPLLNRLPADPATTKMSPGERMQLVVGILNEVDKFNGSISVVSEVQKNPAGAEVQVQTLYLGLGQAYFVDKAREHAGIGVPTPEGWQWTPRPELAPRIARVIAVYENTQPAAFVSLPVTIK
jgi:hypothetical protein